MLFFEGLQAGLLVTQFKEIRTWSTSGYHLSSLDTNTRCSHCTCP